MLDSEKRLVIEGKINKINKQIDRLQKPKIIKKQFIKPDLHKIGQLEAEKMRWVYLLTY